MQISRRRFMTTVGKAAVLTTMLATRPGLPATAQQPSPALGYGQGSYGAGSYPAVMEQYLDQKLGKERFLR